MSKASKIMSKILEVTPKKFTNYMVLNTNHEDFESFLKDSMVKKYLRTKVSWSNKMLVVFSSNIPEENISYVMLKYNGVIDNKSDIVPDLKPVMFKDYWPDADNKFTKYLYENYRHSNGK